MTNGKAKSNDKGKTANKPEAKAKQSKAVVLHVSSDLIDPTVGEAVMGLIHGETKDAAQAKELGKRSEASRNEAIARMTFLFYNAQESLPLAHLYAEGKKDKAALLNAAQVLMGIKEVVDGEIRYVEKYRKVFPPSKPTPAFKETQKYKDARVLQSNFTTKLGKSLENVQGFNEVGAVPHWDNDRRTIRVTNAPKQIAGPSGEAVLSGAQVEGAQEKASLEAFRRIAQRAAGKTPSGGHTTNGEAIAQRALESEDAFGELSASWIKACRGIGDSTLTEAQRKYIESVLLCASEVLGVTISA